MTKLQNEDGKQKGLKLWVDDIRQAPDDKWTVARTVGAAIRAISKFDFDVISLDHDISHQVHVDEMSRPYPCNETFQSVAYYIAERYLSRLLMQELPGKGLPPWKPRIILHTSNPVGAEEMRAIMANAFIEDIEIRLTGAANRLEMEV